MNAREFYAHLAPRYASLTGVTPAAGVDRQLASLVGRLGIKRVVDVACGSGKHAAALVSLGVATVGVDASIEMLRAAKKCERGIWLIAGDMQHVGNFLRPGWDAVLCLGNSLPHLLSQKSLLATLKGFWQLLSPGGHAILQLLNYPLLIAKNERIVAVTRSQDSVFVRFNDYLGRAVRFNVLEIHWSDTGVEHRLISTMLKPYAPDEVLEALRRTGFVQVGIYSGLGLEPFIPSQSRSAVIIAQRPTAS
ncbi:MAG: class I SAM-dependent methyltransferase [candidate division KSB1 bacterium]|nr:class I SAM-dependent methyltransferase [candidate division KSB1 bacterium]